MECPLLSIIIPSFNRSQVLTRAIKSVVEQTSNNWELIIIDDGSTDNTRLKIGGFLKQNRVRYFYQENAGVSAARNKGIKEATGVYITFLDSDDYFNTSFLTELNDIEFWNYDLICWQSLKIKQNNNELWKPHQLGGLYNNKIASFLAGTVAYKKTIIKELGGYDENLKIGENYELGMRITALSKLKIRIVHKTLHHYNVEKHEIGVIIRNKIEGNHILYNKHKDLYLKNPTPHSKLKYQLGLLYEYQKSYKLASKYYWEALKIRPFYFKAILRNIYIKFYTWRSSK